MAIINPWINFNGNAEEAFLFYKSVFGGEFSTLQRFKDLAGAEHPLPDEAEKILRIVLPIGGGNDLVGNDVPAILGRVSENENRSKIFVQAANTDEATRLFTGLSAGGTVEMPLSDSPWGTFFAMFRDKYGIEWIVECGRGL